MTYAATKFKTFRRRCIYKKIDYLTFDHDLGVKVTHKVAQFPLHHVTYAATKSEVARSNGLRGYTLTRNVTDAQAHIRTDRLRTTDRLWYEINIPFFSKENCGYNK